MIWPPCITMPPAALWDKVTPQSMTKVILIQLRPDVRSDGMMATGESDTLSRRYAFLEPYRAPHIVLYLLRLILHVAP
jgi:hypothetical protein